MPQVAFERIIAAPVAKVFKTVASIEEFQKAIPHITNVEITSEIRSGVGTRFKETRLMRGREASTELEVTEHVQDHHVRLVSDAGGSIWDTIFTTVEHEQGTLLTMVMDARPHKLLARLVTPLIMKTISGAVGNDLDAVKEYCEGEQERQPLA